MVGDIKACSVSEFWDLTYRQVAIILESADERRQMQDVRMRKGWEIVNRTMGGKAVAKDLWPLLIDYVQVVEAKKENEENKGNLIDIAQKWQ
jgi:hypothetical protein